MIDKLYRCPADQSFRAKKCFCSDIGKFYLVEPLPGSLEYPFMIFEPFGIEGVFKVKCRRLGDDRGWFAETFRIDLFQQQAGDLTFVQENHSFSAEVGTIRGLHFQINPNAQGKLVRCVRGTIFDVAVDIRTGSPTYGQHVSTELSEEESAWLWLPAGFAHGFATLTPNAELIYRVTAYYSAADDRGVAWNDPALNIAWPLDTRDAVLSAKDQRQPRLADLPAYF